VVVEKTVFRVRRYRGEGQPFVEEYEVPVTKGLTILDGLIYIKENLDGSLSYRMSCRMGVCGSCGMFINGLPRLACHTQVAELNSRIIQVAPLPNFPTVKDLVPDLGPLFDKHKLVSPYIFRTDREEYDHPTREYRQGVEELEAYLQFSYCIKCGICLSACPTVATDEAFFGPQALAQAYRYIADTRDEGLNIRVEALDSQEGPWRCHFAGACSAACPKGVDPALGIQLLKKTIIGRRLGLGKPRPRATIVSPPEGVVPSPEVPKAPPPTARRR